jgi:hypothetical protein
MDIHKGDCVLVNLAPIIGSPQRGKQSIPCRVLTIDGPHLEIGTEFPFREFSMWVHSDWIDGQHEEAARGRRSPHRALPR